MGKILRSHIYVMTKMLLCAVVCYTELWSIQIDRLPTPLIGYLNGFWVSYIFLLTYWVCWSLISYFTTVDVGAQSTVGLRRARHFSRKYMYKIWTKCPYVILYLPKNYQNVRILHDICPKIFLLGSKCPLCSALVSYANV